MKNVTLLARIIAVAALCTPVLASAISMSVNPSGTHYVMNEHQTLSWDADATVQNCDQTVQFTMSHRPMHGSMTLDANFASNGQWSFSNEAGQHGMLGSVKEAMTITATCGSESTSMTIKVSSSTSECSSNPVGDVIFDNTATPVNSTIKSNLAFLSGCAKGSTTISNGFGGNAINTQTFQVMNRDTSVSPHKLMMQEGPEEGDVEDRLFNTDKQLNYFASGHHLFELNRLRDAADWLSSGSNVTPDDGVAAGSYGSITLKQFIQGVAEGKTFYGVVRVKIGLQRGQRSKCTANCNINALRETVDKNSIYGFCDGTTNAGLCATGTACAPGKDFTRIKPGKTICGYSITSSSKIKVKGALFFDFLDYSDESTIPLSALPFAPRELYFMVDVPIMVNWANDSNNDGAMDSMGKISSISTSLSGSQEIPSNNSVIAGLSVDDISQDAKDAYLYQTGNTLTSTEFNALSVADKYHLLMPSGYVSGWAEAFDKLNISGNTWRSLPTASCRDSSGSVCEKFGLPSTVTTGIPSANDLRSAKFEDIPVYLYSGGLIDMHSHVNISGLLYVPQAMEMEALNNSLSGQGITTHQYINGAIVVRDGFYIMANNNEHSITVIAADPTSYSTAKTISTSSSGFTSENGGPGDTPSNGGGGNNGGGDGGLNLSDSSPCIGCIGAGQNGSGNNSSGGNPGKRIWMEVHPQ